MRFLRIWILVVTTSLLCGGMAVGARPEQSIPPGRDAVSASPLAILYSQPPSAMTEMATHIVMMVTPCGWVIVSMATYVQASTVASTTITKELRSAFMPSRPPPA